MNAKSPLILDLENIRNRLESVDVFEAIKTGFIAFSKGEAVIPPVGELIFEEPPGDVHIKYGYLKTQPYYVVKIASGFYMNPKLGLPSSQGLNLLFDKGTGFLKAVLLDEGYLTDVRTAVAGALASKTLAIKNARKIGIIGAGVQAKYQTLYHAQVFPDAEFIIWNRSVERAKLLVQDLKKLEIEAHVIEGISELCRSCDIIVTTTPSTEVLIKKEWIRNGMHITAVGSDTGHKIEIDPLILQSADVLVVDSIDQSNSRGEVFRAKENQFLINKEVMELGQILDDPSKGRTKLDQITVVDLTGVAVQDLMISQAVLEAN